MTAREPLAVHIVSDVVCPWCFLGTVRLEAALEEAGEGDAEVAYLPFLLDPSLPPEGVDLRDRLTRKYGVPAEKMFERVEGVARESGIPLDFSKVRRMSNTLRAHVLLGAAKERGTQRALARALFEAYFLEGRDIGDADVLADVASKHGFTTDEAVATFSDAKATEATRREAAELAAQGISGVPFFVFAEKMAVSGAQSVETLVHVLKRVRST